LYIVYATQWHVFCKDWDLVSVRVKNFSVYHHIQTGNMLHLIW